MSAWLRAHWRALSATVVRSVGAPVASLLNITVIGTALALPIAFYVVLANLQQLAQQYAPEPQVSLFLSTAAGDAEARAIERRLKSHRDVASFRFVSRAQALDALKTRTGLADVLAGLGENPLPDAFVIVPKVHQATALETLRIEMRGWPRVAEVHVDSEWARRLDHLLAIGRYAVLMLATALAFALVAITFNTIRLQVLTQRSEIEVARLIGATDAYVRRPFLYLGAMIGGAGGFTAWLLVWAALWVFNRQLGPLADIYGIPLALTHLSQHDSALSLLLAAALGWIGAWLSVRRHLNTEEAR